LRFTYARDVRASVEAVGDAVRTVEEAFVVVARNRAWGERVAVVVVVVRRPAWV
jgi:hypothetical protein